MKVPLSWIREFVPVTASAEEIGKLMSVRGLALEGLEAHGDDVVMDFDVTANRPDCMSVIGIAREIATAFTLPLNEAAVSSHTLPTNGKVPVSIEAPDLCGRYVGATHNRKGQRSSHGTQTPKNGPRLPPIERPTAIYHAQPTPRCP
jgi:hypothetical protein